MLEINNLSKIYGEGENKVKALDNVSLSIEQGEVVLIVGSSGSGKSTLLNMIGLLDQPTNGKIFIDGTNTTTLDDNEISSFRNKKLGFIFQFSNLLTDLSVLENVLLPREIEGTNNTAEKDRKSTRLNSSHVVISYAVFCLKKKKKKKIQVSTKLGDR